MDVGITGTMMARPTCTTGVAFASMMVLYFAACDGGSAQVEPRQVKAPRVALERVLGTYTGSMTTPRGVEAVVLQIKEIAPLREGFAFRYTLNVRKQREDGLGSLRPGETSTRVCFANEVCGWLLSEGGEMHITSDSGNREAPSWSLEKS